MKTFLLGLGFVMAALNMSAQQAPKSLTTPGGLFIGFYEFKPYNYNANPTKNYPLIIFLHGVGERGNGTSELGRVLAHGVPKNCASGSTMTFTVNGVTESFLTLSPQLSTAYGSWPNTYVDAMINYAKQNLRVDTNRIFLTGLSLGGGGTWDYVTGAPGNADKLAGIAPVCPSSYTASGIPYVINSNLPIWTFHALDDNTCPPNWVTFPALNTINNANPTVAPLKSLYANGGHGIWGRVYDESHTYHNPNVYEWFLMLGRGTAAQPNLAPIAVAGADVAMTLPVNSFTANGSASTDPDGTIAMYEWSKVGGPVNYTIASSNAKNTLIRDLVQGTYLFELKVTDYRGVSVRDTLQVTVNPGIGPNVPPVAAAGSDFSTNLTTTFLSASSSYDPDGYLIAYDWKQESGPSTINWVGATSMFPTISNIGNGLYQFSLTVYDNLGASTKSGLNMTGTYMSLPVEYVFIKGKRSGNKNSISWATASESNSDRFEVERSEDAQIFTVIGKVGAAGNSTAQKQYSFTDEKSPLTKAFYRLRQVDKDGKFKISKVVVIVPTDDKGVSVSFYPNPVKETLVVTLNNIERGKGTIRLLGLDGRILSQELIEKDQDHFVSSVDMSKQKPGVYLVEIKIGDQFRQTQRIVKQ